VRILCKQRRETLGIAARHSAFDRHAVDPGMASSGGEASGIAGHIIAMNEAN
jgi:hypothetical protein